MSGKSVCLGGLVVTLLSLGVVRGQEPAVPYGGTDSSTPFASDSAPLPPATPADQPVSPPGTLSSWLVYPRSPGCCGQVGRNGPLGSEVYVRPGVAFPISGGVLTSSLDPGWGIEGGGRLLLFNPEVNKAWTLDVGIANFTYTRVDNPPKFTLLAIHQRGVPAGSPPGTPATDITVPSVDVTVASLNQTFLYLTAGRQWYLHGTGDCCSDSSTWRFGLEFSGRYGTDKLDLQEIQHRTGIMTGIAVAAYTDWEFPWRCCILQLGLRAEYGYSWNNVLQIQNDSDLQSLNVMVTFGTRF
jgi:hypothetical protein